MTRLCQCPSPGTYADEDGDRVCMICGKPTVAYRAQVVRDTVRTGYHQAKPARGRNRQVAE